MNVPAEGLEVDFCDSVVSELRQPLTAINGGVLLAKRSLNTDPSRAGEALDQVVSQIARLNLLLAELRDRAHDAADAEALFKR
jgi:phosphoglycerate-specific signal transduction histidine kinase